MPSLLPSIMMNSATSDTPPSSSHRGKPMVVDISVDAKGTQTFKVHDSRASRKRKRYSVEEEESEYKASTVEATDSHNITPSRSILRTISPKSLNNDRQTSPEPSNKLSKRFEDDSPSLERTEMINDDNIWSDDVETAFEEALKMIPKNGLTKIKISGKSCGRNELISDYILQVTGKYRTRKQVSSHIQVIKNLKKKTQLINLINNGPADKESLKKFDVVFSEIQFKKSLGTTGVSSIGSNIQRIATPLSTGKSRSRRPSPVSSRPKTPSKSNKSLKPIECQLREFEMSLIDESSNKCHGFSKLFDNKLGQDLRLKQNASISHRFPNLHEYYKKKADREARRITTSSVANKDSNQPPILHNMVQLDIPEALNLSKTTPSTNLKIFLKNLPLATDEKEDDFSCLTTVYSFGSEFIKLIEDDLEIEQRLENNYFPNDLQNIVLKIPFAPEFWTAFLTSLGHASSTPNQRTIAVKSTTIEQIIYRKGSKPSELNRSDIKAMILWEFNINQDFSKQAEVTTRRLYLPNVTPSACTDSILEKSVEPLTTEFPGTTVYQSDEPVDTEDDETHLASDSTYDMRNYQSHLQAPMTPSSIQKNMAQPQVQVASHLHQLMSSPNFIRTHSVPTHDNIHQPMPQHVKRAQSDTVVWGNTPMNIHVGYQGYVSNPAVHSYHQSHHHPIQNINHLHFAGYNSDEFTSFQQQQSFHDQISNEVFNNGFTNSPSTGGQLDMIHQFNDVNMHSFPTW